MSVIASGIHTEPRNTEIAAAVAARSRSSPSRDDSTTAVKPIGAAPPTIAIAAADPWRPNTNPSASPTNAPNPEGAAALARYLASEAGQAAFVKRGFQGAEALVGGDPTAVPASLLDIVKGRYGS